VFSAEIAACIGISRIVPILTLVHWQTALSGLFEIVVVVLNETGAFSSTRARRLYCRVGVDFVPSAER
jgi:hypothetical protein